MVAGVGVGWGGVVVGVVGVAYGCREVDGDTGVGVGGAEGAGGTGTGRGGLTSVKT